MLLHLIGAGIAVLGLIIMFSAPFHENVNQIFCWGLSLALVGFVIACVTGRQPGIPEITQVIAVQQAKTTSINIFGAELSKGVMSAKIKESWLKKMTIDETGIKTFELVVINNEGKPCRQLVFIKNVPAKKKQHR